MLIPKSKLLLESGAPDSYLLEDSSGVLLIENELVWYAQDLWEPQPLPRKPLPPDTLTVNLSAVYKATVLAQQVVPRLHAPPRSLQPAKLPPDDELFANIAALTSIPAALPPGVPFPPQLDELIQRQRSSVVEDSANPIAVTSGLPLGVPFPSQELDSLPRRLAQLLDEIIPNLAATQQALLPTIIQRTQDFQEPAKRRVASSEEELLNLAAVTFTPPPEVPLGVPFPAPEEFRPSKHKTVDEDEITRNLTVFLPPAVTIIARLQQPPGKPTRLQPLPSSEVFTNTAAALQGAPAVGQRFVEVQPKPTRREVPTREVFTNVIAALFTPSLPPGVPFQAMLDSGITRQLRVQLSGDEIPNIFRELGPPPVPPESNWVMTTVTSATRRGGI